MMISGGESRGEARRLVRRGHNGAETSSDGDLDERAQIQDKEPEGAERGLPHATYTRSGKAL
jgi:hypothetical protein